METTNNTPRDFKTQWNAKQTVIRFIEDNQEEVVPRFVDKHEVNNEPSKTIPDDALSVSEIVRRYARGLPLSDVKTPIYHGDDEQFLDISKMDLADREAYIESQRERYDALMKDLQARSAAIREKEAADKLAEKNALIEEISAKQRGSKRSQNPKTGDIIDIEPE